MPRNPLDWTTARLNMTMEAADVRLRQEIRAEQVVSVTDQYQPGSERLEKLYADLAQAQRFTSPRDLTFNV